MADQKLIPASDNHPILLGDGTANDHSDVRLLVDEYARLKVEVEQLREEQKRLKEEQPQKDKEDKDKGKGKKDQKKGKQGHDEEDKDGKDEEEDGDKEDGDDDKKGKGKKDEEEKPKEPFLTRVGKWTRAHPVAVLLIGIGIVVLVIAGILLWKYLDSFESTDDAQVDGHINQISSRTGGTVVGVYMDDSQNVVKGQVLIDLDPHDYQVSLAQANAGLAQAQTSVEIQSPNVPITATSQRTQVSTANQDILSAEAAVTSAQKTYESSLADVRQAEADAANAATEERRYRVLVDKQEISREIYDQRATAARAQQALVSSRNAAAEANRHVVTQRQAELNQARQRAQEAKENEPRQVAIQKATVANRQASAAAARAQRDQALLNLSYSKIIAPVDGIIGDKSVEVGQQVTPGQALFAITQIDDIWVTANFKETQIRRMKPHQAVTIYVDTLTQNFDGYVENMPGATGARFSLLPPENATGNYVKVVQRLPVRIRFKRGQKNEERLRPGMSVEPKVWLQ